MVVFSTLRSRCPVVNISQIFKSNSLLGVVHKRHSGHGREFEIKSSNWDWTKTKDLIHFYTCISVIIYGSILLYANIFVGHPTLREIPEGYVPKHWEYYKHPVSRFIQRYGFSDQQENYEKFLQWFYEEDEQWKLHQLDAEVHRIMKRNKDYQAYYYQPLTIPANAMREEKILSDRNVRFPSDNLSADGFPIDLGSKDTDVVSEFSFFPSGSEE